MLHLKVVLVDEANYDLRVEFSLLYTLYFHDQSHIYNYLSWGGNEVSFILEKSL